ncbi:MAG: SDR family NAD(P)-dependent oxidoreductase [Novosphingobium sp.]|nr:SDR family NAD(P)-dependent oxidoreductase [Novosphingobium sp.]
MDSLRFDGKVAIVTGAGRGLGREYALMLAARGARVLVNDFGGGPDGSAAQDTPADDVVREIAAAGGEARADRNSVIDGAGAIVGAALDAFGQVDILINNAGIAGGGWFPEIPPADWQRMMDTHLEGTVRMSRAAWPHLMKREGSHIVNSSSSASFGAPFTSHYSTAKSAMIGLTRTLAIEGHGVGIAVNAIMPSAYTRLTAQIPDTVLRDFLADHFAPVRVAAFVVWLVSTRISGQVFSVGGGRAARVMLAEGEGAKAAADTPEAWAAAESGVMGMEGVRMARSMVEELCDTLNGMGPEGAAVAARMGAGDAWEPSR